MKRLCFNSFIFLLFFLFGTTLSASLHEKSAIFYLGEKISYPMVGIHDYIVVDPQKTNVYTHGFQVYKKKIYAQIDLTPQSSLQERIQYISSLHYKGFDNFFLNPQEGVNGTLLISLLREITTQSDLKGIGVMLHPTTTLPLQKIPIVLDAFVLYNATQMKNLPKKVKHLKEYCPVVIDVETTYSGDQQIDQQQIKKLTALGAIGYITNDTQDIYGYGVKNAIKREILTIIDDSFDDRIVLSAHQYGALPLEYQGYIQVLYDIKQGLPDPEEMTQYAGVVIWLNTEYKSADELVDWVNDLAKYHIYVAFAHSFGFNIEASLLQQLDMVVSDGEEDVAKEVVVKDDIMDFETQVRLTRETLYLVPPKNSKSLFTFRDTQGKTSTPVAITPWGGYALSDSFMVEIDQENIWVINPFEYFKQALRLKPLPVPDPTTENGSRLFFTHIDGDGYISRAEFDPNKLAGEVIYEEILTKYKVPHSVSIIGAEVLPDGLYPQLSKRCLSGVKKIYALPHIESATHTFTHPFFWGKIKNGDLKEEYRLKPKGYKFSLYYEMRGMLEFINSNLLSKSSMKKAQTVFWSGDCAPRIDALEYTYKNALLNINGGYTTISNSKPWLTRVAPLGIARGEYYQIYSGAQSEKPFTNYWLGPFWGFRKVVQTFQHTEKPRRLKPIDVYYHLYSGSKKASLNALRYVFDWVLKQPDIMPIFTSSYIPKAMDYYTVSLANDGDEWLVSGMRDLKNIRLETQKQYIDYAQSPTVVGQKRINNRTYIALDPHQSHIIRLKSTQEDANYLVSANGRLGVYTQNGTAKHYEFQAEVDLVVKYHLQKGCSIHTQPKANIEEIAKSEFVIHYPKDTHKGSLDVQCR